jgi:DNA-binding NarL/FixJ family response regulator
MKAGLEFPEAIFEGWVMSESGDLEVSQARKRRVFVVDDHPLIRQGLASIISREPDLIVCGEADDSAMAMKAIATTDPDILIVDISLNGPDGLDLLKEIRMRHPAVRVLVLSMHDEKIYAERALRAGAQGYIMKQEASGKVLVALRRILGGEIYISEQISDRMMQRYIGGPSVGKPTSIADLTDRELEVFRLIGEGQSTRQIAETLHISVKTVESYQAHIKEKLSLRSARELVQHAIQWSMDEKNK